MLPEKLLKMPSAAEVRNMYCKSFSDLLPFEDAKPSSDNINSLVIFQNTVYLLSEVCPQSNNIGRWSRLASISILHTSPLLIILFHLHILASTKSALITLF